MPMSYSIDQELRLVCIVGSGRLTDGEMEECVAALRSDRALEPDMSTLSDMRGIEVGFTSAGVCHVVQLMQDTADRRAAAKAAIVTDSDAAFGMARMLELLSDGRAEPSFNVFRDMSEAQRWLGLE